MTRRLALLAALVLVAAGCSKGVGFHWPQSPPAGGGTEAQARVRVVIPATNPYNADNDTTEFRAFVQAAVDKWNPHPDVSVLLAPSGTVCPAVADASHFNCFVAWVVPDTTPNPLAPLAPASCWTGQPGGQCALASMWGTGSLPPAHLLNSNLQQAPDTVYSRVIFPQGWLDDPFMPTAVCHEVGHGLGLLHHDPVTGDFDQNPATPDTTIQPNGPCDPDTAAPDVDPDPTDGTARGYDWSEVDSDYKRCHIHSVGGPPGVPRDPSEPDVAATADNDCGAMASGVFDPTPDDVAVRTTGDSAAVFTS